MPRSTSGITSHIADTKITKPYATLSIDPTTGADINVATISCTNSGAGITYLPYLKRVGDLRMSLFRSTDKVEVVLHNEDTIRGLEVVDGVRAFANAKATIGRLWRHATFGDQYKTLFTGVVAQPEVDAHSVKFSVIDPISAAGVVLANRPMSVKCPYRYKDPRTCGYAGGLTTCNKHPDAIDGCSGRSNVSKFGGWFFPWQKVPVTPTGGGGGGEDWGGGTCFLGETLVTMADGSKKPIRFVKTGDWVLCFYYDEELGRDVVTREMVEDVRVHNDCFEYYEYGLDNGNRLWVTPEHPIYVGKGAFRLADYLRLKSSVQSLTRNGLKETLVASSTWHQMVEPVCVYNLHVRRYHTYFANDTGVHNWKDDPDRPRVL